MIGNLSASWSSKYDREQHPLKDRDVTARLLMPATFLHPKAQSMPSSRISRTTLLRLGLVLLVSLLIHVALFGALPGLPRWKANDDEPLMASIVTPPEPAPVLRPPTPIPPLPRPHLDRPLQRIDPIPEIPQSAPAEAPVPPVVTSDNGATSLAQGGAPGSGPAPSGAVPGAATPSGDTPPAPPPVAPAPPAARPVDAVLEYRVTALDPKKPDQSLVGNGTLSFHSDADHYRAALLARVTFVFVSLTVMSSESSGIVGSDGLEPEHYSETPRNKPTSTATFKRDVNGSSLVSFSQGGEVASAAPGAQDRLTVLLQVGALMQANSALKQAGARFSIPVAGLKGNVEAWNFAVQGLEAVHADTGTAEGWHVSRVLRPGSNDRGIEVWVSNQMPSIPLRVRYSEPDGSTIDLLLASQS
jgi:hypothetical protein